MFSYTNCWKEKTEKHTKSWDQAEIFCQIHDQKILTNLTKEKALVTDDVY